MTLTRLISACASTALASTFVFVGTAGAASADSTMATVTCDKADAALMAPHDLTMPAASSNLDKDFMSVMTVRDADMMAMAKLEIRCGADPKARHAAQRYVQAQHLHRFSGASEPE